MVGKALSPSFGGWASGVGDVESNQRLVGGTVCISSCNILASTIKPKPRHVLSGYWDLLWKETCELH